MGLENQSCIYVLVLSVVRFSNWSRVAKALFDKAGTMADVFAMAKRSFLGGDLKAPLLSPLFSIARSARHAEEQAQAPLDSNLLEEEAEGSDSTAK